MSLRCRCRGECRPALHRAAGVRRAASLGVAVLSGLAVTLAAADPMRPLTLPPSASVAPAGAAAPGTAAAPASGGTPGPSAGPATGSGTPTATLSAIRQDSAGRWQALFGERWLAVGDRVDGLALTAIDGNTVRLGRGEGARTLHLLPALQPSPPVAATAPAPIHRHAKTFASDTRTP